MERCCAADTSGRLSMQCSRTRGKRYTGEDGPAVETITVAVGHCLEDGHYSTILPDDVVRNKQYCISDIRSVLENKEDFSLASPRTRAYWRSWFKSVWDAVVRNLQLCIGGILSEHDISIALSSTRILKEGRNGCGKRGNPSWYQLSINTSGIPWEATL